MRKITGILPLILGCLLGCNHLFYFPDPRELADPHRFGLNYDAFSFPSTDGLTLKGWRFPCATGPAQAVVVHFHGNAENMSTHFLFSAWLSHAGFDVVTFDYRGYGSSEGSPSRQGLVEDGVAALAWVHKNYPKLPIVVFAQSIGGAVAVPAVAESKQDVAALVLESTFGSYRGLAREKLDSVWLTWPLQYPLSFLVTDSYRPLDYASAVKMPVLVVHGTLDPVVPIQDGIELYDAIASTQKEFWKIEKAGHTPAFGNIDSPYREKLVNYLNRTLRKKSAR